MTQAQQLEAIGWPAEGLPDAIRALCEKAGAQMPQSAAAETTASNSDPRSRIEWHARALGCEAETVHTNLRDLDTELQRAFPAILQANADTFVAILETGKHAAHVLSPDLKLRKIAIADLVEIIRQPEMQLLQPAVEALLTRTRIRASRQAQALDSLCREQLALKRFENCWILRPYPGASKRDWLRQTNAIGLGGWLATTHAIQYLLSLTSWAILGTLSFEGRMDKGWLLAWALLLMTLVPFRVFTTWLQGVLAISVGGALKRRLLLGALRLQPDEMRHKGIGGFLGQVLEAETVETLALSGGIAGLLAIIEIAVSGFVLGRLSLLLLAWCILTAFAAWRFLVRYQNWTDTRMEMTQDLVERMVGHRTRLAQERREKWHESEDQTLTGYIHSSARVDRTGTWLVTAIPRGWLLAGVACLVPAVVVNKDSAASVAVLLGGVLLAQTGFKRLTASFVDVAGAWVSWKRIVPLFTAAARPRLLGAGPGLTEPREGYDRVVEAERLVYRYRQEGRPALQGLTMAIHRGNRILLEGPSGGGKTTFASLVSGIREPSAGLLLVNGLDRQTLGEQNWRKAVAAAPQFHENHVLTETLAFNLLMGRRWPPTQADLEEAENLCRELGLGDLLDRMPGGILQMVGEGGWQLSHGERSRIYIARALLQQPDLVILDESFAALDPESLQTALECTLRSAKTLMVIAHP
ncbi:MAG: ABC transporter ATP-binding protein [Acidobacteriaceae bacterium]|nr:ABC transporter ATP-binding protein [Acidobacteriaceae bacterium]